MDCNSGGKAIHPSVVALCVTIFSVSLSHLINSSARKDHQQLHDSNKSVDRFKRVEKVQGMPCAHVSQGKYPYEEVPQATPSSLDQHVQSRSRSICSENTIPSSSDHKSPRHCQRSKEDVNLKKKDKNSTSDMSLVSMKSASCFTAIEVFGKELLVALIFEDLKDKEGQGQMNMHPWIHCGNKTSMSA